MLKNQHPDVLKFKHKLEFDVALHKYYVNVPFNGGMEITFTSASALISNVDDSFDKPKVYLEILEGGEIYTQNDKVLGEIIKAGHIKRAAEVGTKIHDVLEQRHLYNFDSEEFKEWAEIIGAEHAFKYYKDFENDLYSEKLEHDIYKYNNVLAEQRVFSWEHKISGMIDCLCWYENKKGVKKYIIVDYKTNNVLAKAQVKKYTLQQNIYKYILEQEYNIKIEAMYLLHIPKKEGKKYKLIKLRNTQDRVIDLINLNDTIKKYKKWFKS